MACMNVQQKETFLKNIEGVLFNLGHAIHREIDMLFGRQSPTPYSTIQNAYTTHIFGDVFPNTGTPLAVFKQTCKDASNIFADSDGRLADLVFFERAIDAAILSFIQNSVYDGHQITQDFFVIQNLKANLLSNIHSSEFFLNLVKDKVETVCGQVTEKMGFMQDLKPLTGFRQEALKAFEIYMQTQFEADDLEGLKKSIQSAIDTCAACYQKTVEPNVLDYIKAAGLALLGALITLVTLPFAVIFSSYRDSLATTFFAGASAKKVGYETSNTVQTELQSDSLVELVDSFSLMSFMPH